MDKIPTGYIRGLGEGNVFMEKSIFFNKVLKVPFFGIFEIRSLLVPIFAIDIVSVRVP